MAIINLSKNKIFLLLIWTLMPWQAQAEIKSPLPEIVNLKWQDFEMVGETSLKRFGFHVYDASFWVEQGKSLDFLYKQTCALSITYARNISAEKLLSSTKKEWQRLGFADQYPLNAWLQMLKEIWPDVKVGDQLIVVTTPAGTSTFYNKTKSIATIEDPDFGPAFLSIWLDPNSRFEKNRKELLGE